MRVLHVTRVFGSTGGIQAHIEQLCKYSTLHNFPSAVLLCSFRSRHERNFETEINGVQTYIRRFRSIGDFLFLAGIDDLVSEFDVIHIHDFRMLDQLMHFAAFRKYRKPVVISTHGGFFHTSRNYLIKQLYFRTVVPLLLRRVSSVICVSRSDFELFSPRCRNAILLENAFDASGFSASIKALTEPGSRFFYVGRISRNKRVDRLVDLFNEEPLIECSATLDIVGPDVENLIASMQRQVESGGAAERIKYRGTLEQSALSELISGSDFFISASEYEGFGLTVLEAMHAGKVVLIGPLEPLRHIVRDGETGFVLDFTDIKSAACRIREIIELPGEELARVAQNAVRIAKTYTWESRIRLFLDEYCRVALDES